MTETPNTQTTETPPEKPVAPTPLATLAELNALCREKKKVEFVFNGKPCEIEIMCLTPAQQAKVQDIENSVQPPLIKGKTSEEDRFDITNANYIKAKGDASNKARAVGLYWCVPAFQADRPGLTDPQLILNYMQDQLSENILETLWRAVIMAGGVQQSELVNFT